MARMGIAPLRLKNISMYLSPQLHMCCIKLTDKLKTSRSLDERHKSTLVKLN